MKIQSIFLFEINMSQDTQQVISRHTFYFMSLDDLSVDMIPLLPNRGDPLVNQHTSCGSDLKIPGLVQVDCELIDKWDG